LAHLILGFASASRAGTDSADRAASSSNARGSTNRSIANFFRAPFSNATSNGNAPHDMIK
jgi:hypothetical protein